MVSFYRFRSTEGLLGTRQELENQEIFFCPPALLNDPMEGFKDLYWQGDSIAWRNLLKHYLLCLLHAVAVTVLSGKDHVQAGHDKFVFTSRNDLPTVHLRDVYGDICTAFFAMSNVAILPDLLARRPYKIRRDEFYFYLRSIHGVAFDALATVLRKHKLLPPLRQGSSISEASKATQLDNLIKTLQGTGFAEPEKEEEALRHVFAAMTLINEQIDFIEHTRVKGDLLSAWNAVLRSFPDRYSKGLQELIYEEWYAACFVADPNHAAMWGVYADSHRGVCLKFRATDNQDGLPSLSFFAPSEPGAGSHVPGMTVGLFPVEFQRVTYTSKFPEIDFFRSIGRLPAHVLHDEWHRGDAGELSSCADHTGLEPLEWQQRFWTSFQAAMTTKLADWSHEKEHRLILTDPIWPDGTKGGRAFVYQFADLEGIIFGINTELKDKLRIAEIVERKCKEHKRASFEFSQAVYSPITGRIETRPLNLLKFE